MGPASFAEDSLCLFDVISELHDEIVARSAGYLNIICGGGDRGVWCTLTRRKGATGRLHQ